MFETEPCSVSCMVDHSIDEQMNVGGRRNQPINDPEFKSAPHLGPRTLDVHWSCGQSIGFLDCFAGSRGPEADSGSF